MRSFFFTLLVLGALAALLYPFVATRNEEPLEDYPTDAHILNSEELKPPPHTMEAIEAEYRAQSQ